mmetsp:Transcript_6108/g.13557  ORF Transcript_6108/g.13557 Transcript_6108/m.13557 type:complete len:115 (+) Transcript_6108:66-410(+)
MYTTQWSEMLSHHSCSPLLLLRQRAVMRAAAKAAALSFRSACHSRVKPEGDLRTRHLVEELPSPQWHFCWALLARKGAAAAAAPNPTTHASIEYLRAIISAQGRTPFLQERATN